MSSHGGNHSGRFPSLPLQVACVVILDGAVTWQNTVLWCVAILVGTLLIGRIGHAIDHAIDHAYHVQVQVTQFGLLALCLWLVWKYWSWLTGWIITDGVAWFQDAMYPAFFHPHQWWNRILDVVDLPPAQRAAGVQGWSDFVVDIGGTKTLRGLGGNPVIDMLTFCLSLILDFGLALLIGLAALQTGRALRDAFSSVWASVANIIESRSAGHP